MAKEANGLEIHSLRALYGGSSAAKAALDHFASRQKNSSKTTVERLQGLLRDEGHDVSRSEIIDLFRKLEAAHCGQFVIGRKGHASRFEWSVSLISAGKAASGEVTSIEPLNSGEEVEEEAAEELLEHRYRLRPDLEISIRLPADLSAPEAGRIADFVRTLPFSSQ